jgi:hypothetical protein
MDNKTKRYAPSVKMEAKIISSFIPDVMRPKYWPGGNTGQWRDMGHYSILEVGGKMQDNTH